MLDEKSSSPHRVDAAVHSRIDIPAVDDLRMSKSNSDDHISMTHEIEHEKYPHTKKHPYLLPGFLGMIIISIILVSSGVVELNPKERRMSDTEGVGKESTKKTSIQDATGLATKMPFYGTFLAFPIKSALLIYGFGVDKVHEEKGKLSQAILWATFVFVVSAAFGDIKEIYGAIVSQDFSVWEKFHICFVSLGTSSNLQTLVMLSSMGDKIEQTWMWEKAHHQGDKEFMNLGDMTAKILPGWLPLILVLGQSLGRPYGLSMALYCLPVLVLYPYISVPLIWLFLDKVATNWLPKLIMKTSTSQAFDGEAIIEVDEDAKKFLIPNHWLFLAKDEDNAQYKEQAKFFKATGVPKKGWDMFFQKPLFAMLIPLFVTVAARLYIGRGYWPSLADTLGERHLAVYLHSLIESSLDASGVMEQTQVGPVQEMARLVHRWLTFVGYFI